MKDYFKRLKEHPGVGFATLLTIVMFIAGATNQNVSVCWHGGLFGALFGGGFFWMIVLLSNFK